METTHRPELLNKPIFETVIGECGTIHLNHRADGRRLGYYPDQDRARDYEITVQAAGLLEVAPDMLAALRAFRKVVSEPNFAVGEAKWCAMLDQVDAVLNTEEIKRVSKGLPAPTPSKES